MPLFFVWVGKAAFAEIAASLEFVKCHGLLEVLPSSVLLLPPAVHDDIQLNPLGDTLNAVFRFQSSPPFP